MLLLIVLLCLMVLGGILYLRHDRFGAMPAGERLRQMQSKTNFKDSKFDNLEFTPALAEDANFWVMLKNFFFEKDKRNVPLDPIPVEKNDLHHLSADQDLFCWFGHSSYFIQLDGKHILVDPVFSQYASPVRVSIKAFPSEYAYQADDMPEIDLLVYTHDHWDHLDYNTFMQLKAKVRHIVTGLGVGAHLEKWGYPADQISELYWGEAVNIDGITLFSETSRHFSGRTFKRNVTLWSSFILSNGTKKIYIGGDSGYGKHFKDIGLRHGPIDYAILENGQYNRLWKYIHMMPEEVVEAGSDLQAQYVIPVHSGKFPLANHAWDEPLIRVTEAAALRQINLLTPKPGQLLSLYDRDGSVTQQQQQTWWKGLR